MRRLGVVAVGGYASTAESARADPFFDLLAQNYPLTALGCTDPIPDRYRRTIVAFGSLGAVPALHWAREHGAVACIGLIPVVDLDDLIDNQRGPHWETVTFPRAMSPMRYAHELTMPIRFWYRELDHIIPPDVSRAFAEKAPDCEATELIGGHGNEWYPDDFAAEVIDWLEAHT